LFAGGAAAVRKAAVRLLLAILDGAQRVAAARIVGFRGLAVGALSATGR
jgi:hypothetical protein